MDIIDFEEAIHAMPIDITMDEVVFHHGNTKVVYGHSRELYLKWNGEGKCFSFCAEEPLPKEPIDTKEKVPEVCWCRHEELDIKKKLWHTPDEEPEHHKDILIEYKHSAFSENLFRVDDMIAKLENDETYTYIRWAYIEDILEKLEE